MFGVVLLNPLCLLDKSNPKSCIHKASAQMVGARGGTSHYRLGKTLEDRALSGLRLWITPTLLQGDVHLATGKALITRFLPDTPISSPLLLASCVKPSIFPTFLDKEMFHLKLLADNAGQHLLVGWAMPPEPP